MKFLIACLLMVLTAGAALAQDTRRPSHCIAIADAAPGLRYLHQAAWTDPIPDYSLRIQYIAHASFLIQTRAGSRRSRISQALSAIRG